MYLTLEVTAVSGQPPQTPLRLELREGSRLLGRNADNDLVLQDSERMVSGLHARVEAAGDDFVLVDLSTNGTYLNDGPDPLPRNQPTPLRDGDLLQIGPYDIAVAIAESAEPDTAELPETEPPPPPVTGFLTRPQAYAVEPGAGAPPPDAPAADLSDDDLFGESSPGRAPRAEPQASDDVLPGLELPGAGADILDLLGGDDQPGDGRLLERAADPFAEPPGAEDLLADPDADRGTAPTPTPVERVFFQPPAASWRGGDNRRAIPDDYDLLGDIEPPAPAAPEPGSAAESGSAPGAGAGAGPGLGPEPEQVTALEPAPGAGVPPVAQRPPAAPGWTEPEPVMDNPPDTEPVDAPFGHPPGEWGEAVGGDNLPTDSGTTPDESGLAPAEPPPASGRAGTAVPEPLAQTAPPGPSPLRPEPGRRSAPPPAAPAGTALGAFLAGLGTGDPGQIQDPDAFLRRAGMLLRTMVAGLSTTLMARTQFKSEMRLGVTTIRATENNPFKFSVSVEDALERLLLRDAQGYLPAQEAAKQGFEDIQAHEMAMIAGLRSALDELLGRFAPAVLEAELADKSLDKVLPMVRKARCWDLLGERHAQISSAASEDFMKVFGEAFSRAYDEQVALLAQARRERGR